ncbi:MAG: helix-turn-helix transcriptional regulator [Alphaproteobacteria bacterium]|nr:helix-turn-helix domain-containing protein [Alphaproteobacteria bacterium]MDE1968828.1 helix-turn-helix transcriptional regulator [Alphaproteobacteria bacterium]MDE2512754.1 helix-turn-helix transcriptional regulator [Alphaproteobacteria bacterium]
MREFFNTAEVADYLRLKERTIYELVRTKQIPCSRVTGKLLFPRQLVDLWVTRQTEFAGPDLRPAPPVAAGSHDPLLEWALRESGSELALLAGGSDDGLRRLVANKAIVAGIHLLDPVSGEYNRPAVRALGGLADVVLIEWAKREQGLVVVRDNPHRIATPADLGRNGVRVLRRQDGAGAQVLLRYVLAEAKLRLEDLPGPVQPALTETDIAAAILDGKADAGVAVRAVAQRHKLGFVPLRWERFDLAMRRRDYFEPSVQKLLRFARTPEFVERAQILGGYDLVAAGTVTYNA